jgi:hypothetical protein
MQQTLDSLHANVFRTKLDSAAAVAPRLLYQRAIDGMDQEESGVLPGHSIRSPRTWSITTDRLCPLELGSLVEVVHNGRLTRAQVKGRAF